MKKIFLLILTGLMIFSMSACEESKDNTVKNDGKTDEIITSDITVDEFFEKTNGYWGVKNDPYSSWDAFGFEDNKVMFFTYPGEYWFTDGIVESIHTEDDGTIAVDISYMYFELGSEEGTPSNLKLRIKSENDFGESFVASFGEDYTEYKYMGETFEQMKAFADTH